MVHTISNEPSQIFISYAEEDRVLAEQIASGLQAAGYRTWRYELDCPPGIRYPEAINRAIEQSLAVVLLVSSHSLGSQQVTNEVLQASAKRKTVVPVLVDMTHAKFQRRQPAWTEAIGPVMSIHIPAEGATTAMSRLLQGIKALATAPAGAEPTRAAGPLKPSEDLFTSAGESPGTNQETEPEFRYSNLFQIASFRLPYVVLIGGWESGVTSTKEVTLRASTIPQPYMSSCGISHCRSP